MNINNFDEDESSVDETKDVMNANVNNEEEPMNESMYVLTGDVSNDENMLNNSMYVSMSSDSSEAASVVVLSETPEDFAPSVTLSIEEEKEKPEPPVTSSIEEEKEKPVPPPVSEEPKELVVLYQEDYQNQQLRQLQEPEQPEKKVQVQQPKEQPQIALATIKGLEKAEERYNISQGRVSSIFDHRLDMELAEKKKKWKRKNSKKQEQKQQQQLGSVFDGQKYMYRFFCGSTGSVEGSVEVDLHQPLHNLATVTPEGYMRIQQEDDEDCEI
jgi:hypothetical protein